MGRNISYYSTDKLYNIKKRIFDKKSLFALTILLTIILIIVAGICFNEAISINSKNSKLKYNENGSVDYKVYLKDNKYYESSYLKSGLQYVSSLIKTVNVKFKYKMKFSDDVEFNNKYKIIGKLQIAERNNPEKILYTKNENFLDEKSITLKDDELIINEEVDIDYDKYNSIVSSYQKELGLFVSSNLILKLETYTDGIYENEKISKDNEIKITIPLFESTVGINIDTKKFNKDGDFGVTTKLIKVNNKSALILLVFVVMIIILCIRLNIYIYLKYIKKDIYTSTVGKILKDYDRLIVVGDGDIDESMYHNKFYPKNFNELLDAAQNLEVPIMYYEAIPGEKSFFIAVKDNTLYKYRISKAYLEKENDKTTSEEIEVI